MQDIYRAVVGLIDAGQAGALATVVAKEGSAPQVPGAKMLVRSDGSIVGTVGGGAAEKRACDVAAEVIKTGQARLITVSLAGNAGLGEPPCGGRLTIFIEPVLPLPPLLVFGAGHVGRAMTKLGAELGYRVTVIDERPEYARLELLPGASEVKVGVGPEIADQLCVNAETQIVIVTHGHTHDRAVLRWALGTSAGYIGMMASRRKVQVILEDLKKNGFSDEQLKRVHTPIGLDIGAVAPAEIAVSIAAELIRLRRGSKWENAVRADA
jgi:xanthine dehydrogenase accessory factor